MRFETPAWFFASAAVVLGGVAIGVLRQSGMMPRPAILFANLAPLKKQGATWRTRLRRLPGALRMAALILLIVALARPQIGRSDSVVTSEGIDIVLAVDTSGSMAAEDFGESRTRLDHVVDVIHEFIERRPADRIGLVAFGRNAYTRCPLTLDHDLLDRFLERVLREWERAVDSSNRKQAKGRDDFSPREANLTGTAIGDGIVMSVSRLEESDAKSRVVVLLSDGTSNAGDTQPQAAADLASQLDVKVYAIGAGTNSVAPVARYDRLGRPVKVASRSSFDEKALQDIADTTGARYFHASSRERLGEIYEEIDRLERVELKSRDFREWDERFMPWALAALGVFMLELLLSATILRSLP